MHSSAEDYLAAALAIMEQHALHRDRINWPALRLASAKYAEGASAPADTYDVIRWALTQLEDGHSFLAPPECGDAAIASGEFKREISLPDGEWLANRIACLRVPGFRGSPQHATRYAEALQTQIAEMDVADPVGWVVDLTENWGGDMWPMLAGLGPLLGEGPLGSFTFPHDPPAIWSYRAGQAWLDDVARARSGGGSHELRHAMRPVALLTSEHTSSSGEAVLIAFIGRPDTRRLGMPTRGLTTANDGFPLQDGATIMLTVGTYADRLGRVYGHAIEPDQYVKGNLQEIQAHAVAWICETNLRGKSRSGN